jgi:hypothetical protein
MRLNARTVFVAPLTGAIVACLGVPKASVSAEADVIDRNAQAAQALHALCVDGGTDSPGCAAESKKLQDIRSAAQTLKEISK